MNKAKLAYPANSVPNMMPIMATGNIQLAGDKQWIIKTDMGPITATEAASCLLLPSVGDEVLYVQTQDDRTLILAILTQANQKAQTYKLGESVHFNTIDGELLLNANQFTAVTTQAVNIFTQNLTLSADIARSNYNKYELNSEYLTNTINHMQSFVGILDQNVDTYNLEAKHLFQRVSELQHQVLGYLQTYVQHNYRLDCDTADIYAKGDVKLDGEQVLLG